jgi:hypothetical protein
MTILDLQKTDLLVDKICDYQPNPNPNKMPQIVDKWMLASNLQKCIRRGLVDNAAATAIKLVSIDPKYFWRRLLVIAYEDIGVSAIPLCHELLKTFRREALHRDLGVARVAAYFAVALANSRKSRTLCDAIAMLEFNVRLGEIETRCTDLTDSQLTNLISSVGEPMIDRVAALRHICGYRENAYSSYRMITPPRPDLMREVCSALALSDIETALFLSGQNTSESMNVALPVVIQLARGEQHDKQSSQNFEGTDGLLYATLDRHTRIGKRCFAKFAKEISPATEFFQKHPDLKPVDVLGVAVFIIEGSQLDHWVTFPESDDLRQTFERNFLEHTGLTGAAANELLTITSTNLPSLNRIRAEALKQDY